MKIVNKIKYGIKRISFFGPILAFKMYKNPKKTYKKIFDKYMIDYKCEAVKPIDSFKYFAMWWQGLENAPTIVKSNLARFKHEFGDSFILITQDNYHLYVDIPDELFKLLEHGGLAMPQLADFIRMQLLVRYGGCWLDATCVLLGSFPREEVEASIFYSAHTTKSPFWDHWTHKGDVSSFFLATNVKNCVFLHKFYYLFTKFIFEYNGTYDYLLIDIIFGYLIDNYQDCRDIVNLIPTNNQFKYLHFFEYNADKEYNESHYKNLGKDYFLIKGGYKHTMPILYINEEPTYYEKLLEENLIRYNSFYSAKLISIIVPIYNTSKYLNQCLKSLSNQTYRNIEVILIDDGSTDNSLDIATRYIKNDTRFKLISKENEGVTAAVLKGIEESTGEFIGFVDSDDYVDPVMFEMLMSKMGDDIDLVVCNYFNLIENKVNKANTGCKNLIYQNDEYNFYTKFNQQYMGPFRWNKLFRKTIVKQVIPNMNTEQKFLEDHAFVNVYYSLCKNVSVINNELYYYRRNIKSIMTTWKNYYIDDISKCYEIYKKARILNKNSYTDILHCFYEAIHILVKSPLADSEKLRVYKNVLKNNIYKEALQNGSWNCYSLKQFIHKQIFLHLPWLYIKCKK